MEKYQFSVDGALVSVYPLRSDPYDRERIIAELCEGELAVMLYPDHDADFLVTSYDKNNNEPREPALIFAALSFLFKTVRGYPKMTLDVKYGERMYELPLIDDNVKISVNVGKSKILCTKAVKFADGIEILARAVAKENTVAVTVCRDSELFDEGRLRLLLSSLLGEGARSAIAVSASDGFKIKSVGNAFFYEVITAGVAALLAEGIRLPEGRCACELNGREHVFSITGGNLTFHSRIDCVG